MDVRHPWAWMIWRWTKGAVSPDTVVNDWTVHMVLEALDMIAASEEIEYVVSDSTRPKTAPGSNQGRTRKAPSPRR